MKKNTFKLLVALFMATTFFASCDKIDELVSANLKCKDFSLVGTWVRQNDPGLSGNIGMEVTFNGTTGYVTSSPSTSQYPTGTLKWASFDNDGCVIRDLLTSGSYNTSNCKFKSSTEFIIDGINGEVIYKRK